MSSHLGSVTVYDKKISEIIHLRLTLQTKIYQNLLSFGYIMSEEKVLIYRYITVCVLCMFALQVIIFEGQDKNPEMCRVLLTHEIMCRSVRFIR